MKARLLGNKFAARRLAAGLSCVLGLAFAPPAAAVSITELPLPREGALPCDMTAGTDRAVWYLDCQTNRIGRVDVRSGQVREFPIPYKGWTNIVAAPDGRIWITMEESFSVQHVGVFDPRSRSTTIAFTGILPPQQAMTLGSDGGIWIATYNRRGDDRLADPGGALVRIDLATHGAVRHASRQGVLCCEDPVEGADGSLYFTEKNPAAFAEGERVVRLSTGERVSPGVLELRSPLAAPDGTIWYIGSAGEVPGPQSTGNPLFVFSPSNGAITTVDLGLAWPSSATSTAVGPDQAVWAAHEGGVSRISLPGHQVRRWAAPTFMGERNATGLTNGPDGNLWFVETAGLVGRVDLDGRVDVGDMDTALADGIGSLVDCDGPCRGSVDARLASGRNTASAAARRRGGTRVAHRRVRLRAAAVKPVRVRISRGGRKRIRREGRLARLTVVVRVRERGQRARVARRTVLLRDAR